MKYPVLFLAGSVLAISGLFGCGAQPGVTNVNLANSNTNANRSNTAAGNASNNNSGAVSPVETKEPDQYEATVTLKFEAVGGQQNLALPTLSATVARSGTDRRMEFAAPVGGKVEYLDKGGTTYVILPDKKQYTEINRDSTGFEVRRLLMPEQIVQQVKSAPGVERVGEEKYNGRDAIRYRYGAVTDTRTQAGQVATESFFLVDKETGLPLHTETLSRTQSGTNVQGYSGVRVITEIADLKTAAPAEAFELPTGFQKVDAAQVRSQVDLIFSAVAAFVTQMLQQGQSLASPTATPAG